MKRFERKAMYLQMKSCLVLAIFAGGLLQAACVSSEAQGCIPKAPPLEAAATMNHGQFLFFHPKSIGKTYTGYQTMWDEKGHPLFVLSFESGKLVKYEATNREAINGKDVCKYRGERLISGPAEACPDYQDLQAGFRSVKGDDLPVPVERDPRRRSD